MATKRKTVPAMALNGDVALIVPMIPYTLLNARVAERAKCAMYIFCFCPESFKNKSNLPVWPWQCPRGVE